MAAVRRRVLDRTAVIDAAVDLVERRGLEGLRMDTLAKRLRVKPPSLYNHVASRADLLRATATAGWQNLVDSLGESPRFQDPRSYLRDVVHRYRDFARARPRLYRLMSSVPLVARGSREAAPARALFASFAVAMEPLGIEGDDAVHLIRALRSAVHGFMALEAEEQFQLGAPPDESFERMVDALLDGWPVPTRR